MLCDDCQKRAAYIHIAQVIDNQRQEKWLCGECAKAYGAIALPNEKQFSFQDLLTGLLSHNYFNEVQPQDLSCTNCGMTYREFESAGKFGCADCYGAFSARLEPLLRRIHGASNHNGKLPRRSGAKLEVTLRIQRLRQEQERCVRQEEYEEAARLRDQIRALEKELTAETEGGGND